MSKEVAYPERADDYEVFSPAIGKGAFAKVYRARVKALNVFVALKILPLEDVSNLEDVRKEIMHMRQMRHPNVVFVHTAFSVEENLWIIMPLLRASVADGIKSQCPRGIKDEVLLATILKFCLQGLHYFHKDGFIHRDIKAGNVLLSDEGEVQLADFGVAGKLIEEGDRKAQRRTFTGTPCWMAPEVMEQTAGYDCKADIWSFGIMAMELAFGSAPYAQFLPMKVLMLTLQNDPPTIDVYSDQSYKFSSAFTDMLKLALVKDPKKRKPATEILKHSFFKQAKETDYIKAQFVKSLPRNDPNKPLVSFRGEKETKESAPDDVVFVFDAADLRAATAKIQKGDTSVDLQPIRQPASKVEQKGPPGPPPPGGGHQRVGSVGSSSRFTVEAEGGGHGPPPPPSLGRSSTAVTSTSPGRPELAHQGTSRFIVVETDQDSKTTRSGLAPAATPYTIVTPTGHVFTTTEK